MPFPKTGDHPEAMVKTLATVIMALKNFCRQYPFQRKVLIVPSYRAGNELRESLARDAGGFINLCAETVDGLARKSVDLLMAQKALMPISSSQATRAFENVYRQLDESGGLFYFARKGDSDKRILGEASLVATTLTKTYTAKQFPDQPFDVIIIDESSMAPLPHVYWAVSKATAYATIVGQFVFLKAVLRQHGRCFLCTAIQPLYLLIIAATIRIAMFSLSRTSLWKGNR